ncbi:MAG: L,D-transpeptidase family protein, partial [Verrucomicrobiota bacterium]
LCIGCSSARQGSVPPIAKPIKPQQYTWYPQRSTSGPVLVFVSIPRQEAVVYRNGIRIGRAAVSTGREGHNTPTGVFQILEKDANHRSSTYNSAPMPYMERLTWDGVALHTGFNPGRPDSHGCIRLPNGFAKELYGVTRTGGTVVVSDGAKLPTMDLTEGFGETGAGVAGSKWSGSPGGGTMSLALSTSSRKACVYQNGAKVGESPLEVKGGLLRFRGERVLLLSSDLKWQAVDGGGPVSKLKEEIQLPEDFRQKIRSAIRPGATLVITSEPLGARAAQNRDVMSGQ